MVLTQERQQARLAGVDVARGVALLGMMAVHVYPAADPGGTTLVHHVASGRASALFAVLAGTGLALLTGGTRPRVTGTLRTSVALRALLVALVGLVLGVLPAGVAVILVYYGALFLVAVPLLGLPVRVLVALAAVMSVAGPVLGFLLRPELPDRARGNPGLGTPPDELLSTLLVTGYYPVLSWTAYLCAGLAVGRLALGSPRVQAGLLATGAALALGASLLSSLLLGPLGGRAAIEAVEGPGVDLTGNQFGNVPTSTPWFLALDAPHATTPPDIVHTTGTALVVLALALLLTRSGAVRTLLRPLAAAGAMPLTLYSTHVVVLAATTGDDPALLWSAQVVLFLVFAPVWLRAFRRGPLEGLVATASQRD